MKKSKIVKLCTLLLIASSLLVSCSEYNDNYSDNMTADNKEYAGEEIYKKKLSDSLEVNAKVEKADLSKVETFSVERKKFDANKATEMFFGNEEITISRETESYNNEVIEITKFESNDGRMLEIFDGNIEYTDSNRDYVNTIVTLSDSTVWNKENLDFMDKDTAIKKAIEVCNKLNIKVANEPAKITCIDIDNLKSEEKKIKESPVFYEAIQRSDMKKQNISKENEAYIIDFSIEEQEIKYNEDIITLQTVEKDIDGGMISVIIDKNGVAELQSIGVIYEKRSLKKANPKIMTLDEALDKVNNIYKDILTKDSIKVSKIGFRYTTSIDNNTYLKTEVIPTWCFVVESNESKAGIEESEVISNKIYINAITGKEII